MKKYIKMSQKSNFGLSVVIVSFNTRDILEDCLNSLKLIKDLKLEIIVVDNASKDGSLEMLEKRKNITLLKNNKNIGFGAGNNKARSYINSDYVLFLNSDTIVNKNSLKKPLQYIKENSNIGAITCKVVLPSGELDPDTRRVFPTPLTALKHFTGFSKTYRYLHKDEDEIHDVDVIQAAFLLAKKQVLDEVDWFDEDYFLDGEDIDLCWKIKQAGFRLVYYPKTEITHIKKASKNTDRKKSLKSVLRGVEAMEIFYKKHLAKNYNIFINFLVYFGIFSLKFVRTVKYKLAN